MLSRHRWSVGIIATLLLAAACQQPTPGVPATTDTVHVTDTVSTTDTASRASLDSLHHVLDSLVVVLDSRPQFVHDTVWQTHTVTVTVVDSTDIRAWASRFATLQSQYDALAAAPAKVDTFTVTDTAAVAGYQRQLAQMFNQHLALQAQYDTLHTAYVTLQATAPTVDTVRIVQATDTVRIACDSVVAVTASRSQVPDGWPMSVRGDSVYYHESAARPVVVESDSTHSYRVCLKQVYTFVVVPDSVPLPPARVPVVAPITPAGYTTSEGSTVPAVVSTSLTTSHPHSR